MMETPMMLGQTSKGNGKGRGKLMLKRISIEAVVNGFVVRCDYESSGKESQYDSKTKVFEDAEEMAKFVGKAFGGEADKDEEDEEEEA